MLIFYERETKLIFFSTGSSLRLCLCQSHANTWPQPYFQFSPSLPLPLWRDVMGAICLAPALCSTLGYQRWKAKPFIICVEQEAQQESTHLKTDTLWVSPCVIYKVLFLNILPMAFLMSNAKLGEMIGATQSTVSHCFRLFASSYLLFSNHNRD